MYSQEAFQIVVLEAPKTSNGGFTATRAVNVKGATRVRLHVVLKQTVGHATAISPKQCTSAAAAGAAALTNACVIWATEDCSANAAAKTTSATTYTPGTGATQMHVVFDIDPAECMTGATYSYIGCAIANSSQATNFACIWAEVYSKHQTQTPAASNMA